MSKRSPEATEEKPADSGRRPLTSGPEIKLQYAPVGRETWSAITSELGSRPDSSAARSRMNTKPYGDRISNAPGARAPSRAPADTAPEITIGETGAGRETLAAINRELSEQEADAALQLEPFEMVTFVVRGPVSELSADRARRAFVEERLMHRLPVESIDQVDRVDVTPWTERGTVVVRVWCRV